jgi:hypothetical protein
MHRWPRRRNPCGTKQRRGMFPGAPVLAPRINNLYPIAPPRESAPAQNLKFRSNYGGLPGTIDAQTI